MKKLVLILAVILCASSVYAASPVTDYAVKNAIYKYKIGNYTGCLQDLKKYVKSKPTALAYYYLGMSYAQAGLSDDALESYKKSIELATKENNANIKQFATIGKNKVENPYGSEDVYKEIDTILKEKNNNIPEDLTNDLKKKHLEYFRNEVNSDKPPTNF